MARLTAIIAVIFALIQINASFTIRDDVVDRETKRYQAFFDNTTDVLETERKTIDNLKNVVDAKIATANTNIKTQKDALDKAIADEIQYFIYTNDVCLYCASSATQNENNVNVNEIIHCSETLNLENTETYKKISQLTFDATKTFTKCKMIYTSDDDLVTCVENDITNSQSSFEQLLAELKEEVDGLNQNALDCVANDEKNFVEKFQEIQSGLYACAKGCSPGPF